MADDFKDHLASELVSEQKTVSYRTLARALKVHANAAKYMLYEFYGEQNKRKPGSLYATYLISGTKKHEEKSQDTVMTNGKHAPDAPPPSSPPIPSSSMVDPSQQESLPAEQERIKVRTVTLVREENLEDVQQLYEQISSLHIYSLSPTKPADLVSLTDLSRGLYTDVFAKEDPLLHNKIYGVIQNPQVRRRKGKRSIVPAAAPTKAQPGKAEAAAKSTTSAKPAPKPTGIAASLSRSSSALKKEDTASRPSSRDSTSTSGSKPTLKRDASDIFKAFAKGKTKLKPKNDSQEADTPMSGLADDDEGESEDEALFLDTGNRQQAKKRASDFKKEREDKAAKLKKMMDSDDEDAAESRKATEAPAKTADMAEEVDPDAVAWSESDTEAKPKTAVTEETTGPKRRRGKRKVVKKRTMKDEDGYLVTKEEEAWESFSETDDEDATKPKAKSAFAGFGTGKSSSQAGKGTQKSAAASGKKAAAGGGKKDIMSFFGKK